jgi:hypothetical protein
MSSRTITILVALSLAGLVCVYAADITGTWATQFDSQVGLQKYTFEFKVDGTKLTGRAISNIAGADAKTELTEGKLNGDEVTFVENLNYQGMELKITYKGKISGDEIKFQRTVGDSGGEEFVAKRVK